MKFLLCLSALVAVAMSNEDLDHILKKSNDKFTASMFHEAYKNNVGQSMVISAFSVLPPLAQLALASVGESHDEILKVIDFPNDNVTKAVFADVNKKLRSVEGITLKLATRLYVRNGDQINEQFAGVSRDVFGSDVKNVDFAKKTEAAKEINGFVEDNTNHLIKDLVSPDELDESVAAMLVNAIYFKGKWKTPFRKSATHPAEFHVTKDKKVEVPMMHITSDFKYGESQELDAQILEMFYQGDESSLVVILPKTVDGISSLVEKLKNPTTLSKAIDETYNTEVEVSLPKFKISTTTDLKDVLSKMHINKLFSPGQARLENLLKGSRDLYISAAKQKAFIDVNEEGAEAAAANEFTVNYRSAKIVLHTTSFVANRPFYYVLKQNNLTLFNGVFQS